MRKKLLFSMMCAIFSVAAVYSQASFDVSASADFIVGSGQSKIILSDVKGVANVGDFTVSVTSGSANLNGTPTVEYVAGQNFALLNVTEKGTEGTASIKISAGSVEKTITVNIVAFSNPGIELSIYDVQFWQVANVIQTGAPHIYREIMVDKAEMPSDQGSLDDPTNFWYGKWNAIRSAFTVGNDCNDPPCNPFPLLNLGTVAMKGYFIPKVAGNYTFSFHASRNSLIGGVWLDPECGSWNAAEVMACTKGAHGGIVSGTMADGNTRVVSSTPVALEANKAYPIYGIRWFTHAIDWDISYKLPGDTDWTIIPAECLSPLYDIERPAAPASVKIHTTMNEKVLLEWSAVSSGTKKAKVAGYNIYANGKKNNTELVAVTTFLLTGLTANTDYDIFATSVDELGNESLISNVVHTKTTSSSTTPPSKPTGLRCETKTGEVLKMRWGKSAGIVAYDISVDGVKHNADYIYTDSFFVRKLKPETEYAIRVRGYNGSLTASEWSEPVNATTVAFDSEGEQLPGFNEYRVRLDVGQRNISWSEGIGINVDVKGKIFYSNNNDNYVQKMTTAYNPGLIRWGALDANLYGLQTVTGSGADAVGTNGGSNPDSYFKASIGKKRKDLGLATHAMNMAYCNEIGSYYALCIGTKDSGSTDGDSNYTVDYMDPVNGYKVFQNLVEYLAGPSSSPLGMVRAQEGFFDPVLVKGKSKGIILEFGNEVWGSTSHNAPIGRDYVAYGAWCRAMADSMRKSPYWKDVKDLICFAYSGRGPSVGSENQNVTRGTALGQIQGITISGYLGGNGEYDPDVDYGQSMDHYYRLRISQIADNLKSMQALMKDQIGMTGGPLKTYFYETQVSTPSYFGNLGQAVVLFDYITATLRYGGMVPALFAFGGGQWMVNVNDAPLAHLEIGRLVNTYCKGHIVEATVATNNQVMIDRQYNDFKPVVNFDPVGASVYNNGKNWSILLFSRDFDNEYSVQINLPDNIGTIKNVKRHTIGGNEEGPSIRLGFDMTENEAATLKDGDVVYVKPYSMVLYTFEANNPGFEALPLGHYDRVLPQTLELTGTPEITTTGGNTRITAVVGPDNTFATNVIWEFSNITNKEVVEAGMVFPVMVAGLDYAIIRASSPTSVKPCNGTLWLTATTADNPALTKSIQITLSNQTVGCQYPYIGVNGAETEAMLSLYPNPAEETLFVNTNTDALSTVTIYSSIGIRIMAEISSEQVVELNVASLPAGQYTAVVESNGKTEAVTFVKR